MFTVKWHSHFVRRARKFARVRPDLRGRLADILRDLEIDPYQPHLRLHALQGELAGYHAVSVTYAYRIVLIMRIEATEIELYDIGGHDEVYRP